MKGILQASMKCSAGAPLMQTNCYANADEYMLMGCFNMHITETALCAEHATIWLNVQDKYKHQCHHCDLFIQEYLPIRIHHGQ